MSKNEALERECVRYGLNYREVLLAQSGEEFGSRTERKTVVGWGDRGGRGGGVCLAGDAGGGASAGYESGVGRGLECRVDRIAGWWGMGALAADAI